MVTFILICFLDFINEHKLVNTVHYSLETIALGAALIDGFSPICNSTDEATRKHVVVVEKYPFLLTYEGCLHKIFLFFL